MIQHLLLAIDRRAGSFRSAALGLRLAWCCGARVTVLFVVTQPSPMSSGDQARSHDAVDAGERLFRRVRRMAAIAGVPCVCRYAFGRDAQTLVSEAAATHRCDLIVLGGP